MDEREMRRQIEKMREAARPYITFVRCVECLVKLGITRGTAVRIVMEQGEVNPFQES